MLPRPRRARLGSVQPAQARDVAQRVAARVAKLRGIGHLADADAVEDNPDYARNTTHSTVTCCRGTEPA